MIEECVVPGTLQALCPWPVSQHPLYVTKPLEFLTQVAPNRLLLHFQVLTLHGNKQYV